MVCNSFTKRSKSNLQLKKLKVITESGMLLAVALALSQFKLFQMPSGGSISIGILPLLILSARQGVVTGCVSGAILGFLLLTTRPFILHPLQFLLDYPLAYASIGLAGAVSWTNSSPWINLLKATTATTMANIIRLHLHVIAGAIFFVTEKDTVYQALIASYVYNLSHMVPETIICVIIVGLITRYHQELCTRQINTSS